MNDIKTQARIQEHKQEDNISSNKRTSKTRKLMFVLNKQKQGEN